MLITPGSERGVDFFSINEVAEVFCIHNVGIYNYCHSYKYINCTDTSSMFLFNTPAKAM